VSFVGAGDIKGAGSGSHYPLLFDVTDRAAVAERVHVEHARPSSVNPNGPLIAPRHRAMEISKAPGALCKLTSSTVAFHFFPSEYVYVAVFSCC
jgi:hypothetical protein